MLLPAVTAKTVGSVMAVSPRWATLPIFRDGRDIGEVTNFAKNASLRVRKLQPTIQWRLEGARPRSADCIIATSVAQPELLAARQYRQATQLGPVILQTSKCCLYS